MKHRATALVFLLTLVLAACGARLTDNERLAGIRAGSRGGTAAGGDQPGGVDGPGATTSFGPIAGPTSGGGGTGSGTGGGAAVPPGGNGGATDTGVTATEITVAVASDISGVQPGLFKSTHQAMSAWSAMVNSEGGLYGRRVKALLIDTRADSTQNRAAVTQACEQAFALVGSMSAFDNGGAEVGQSCGIPDLSAITVNASRSLAKNVYAVHPIRPDKFAIGTANYIKEKYPAAIKQAAMLYLNAGVTKQNAEQRMNAYKTVGFNWTYVQEVQVLEANYTPFVQEMRDRGIRYVNMVANYQSIVRLLNAMEQAEWYPEVRDWDSVAYSPGFIAAGEPTEGSLVFLTTGISEEISSNPEMQLYVRWLNRVAPGAKPDYFGFYAWSAGRLFAHVHQAVGAKITRKAFFDAIRQVHSWNGNGLHVSHDIGNKLQSPCFFYIEVKGGTFVRKDPPSGYMCNMGGVINT